MPSAGPILISSMAVFMAVGSFVADFNETHVYNPRWPPHARYHNGQTMSMAASLGAATLYYAWRSHRPAATEAKKESIFTAALFGSLYCFTGLTAILYPGALGMDPEFGEGWPQKYVFGIPLIINWVGWWLENRRLSTANLKKTT
jgi:hypothetical protein